MYKPLFWHHGLFLQPQHFQYQEKYLKQAINQVWQQLAGDAWGLISSEINSAKLSAGEVELSQGSFVFQDGTWVVIGENAVVEDFSVSLEDFGGASELLLYVCLNTSEDNKAQMGSRYSEQEQKLTTSDYYRGGDPVELPVLTLQPRLALKHQASSSESAEHLRYVQAGEQKFAIARLVWRNDQVELDAEFIPSCLNLKASPGLATLQSGLLKELLDRCRQLEDYKGGVDKGELSNQVFRYRLALQTLSRYTAQLDHFSNSTSSQPEDLYLCLKQLLAEISVFSTQLDVLGRKSSEEQSLSYDHVKADRSFKHMKDRVLSVLNELSVRPENFVRLEHRSTDLLQASLPKEFAQNLHRVFVIVRSSKPLNEWQEELLGFAKFGPANVMPILLDKAIPGIALVPEQGRPEGLPHRPNSWYYRLNLSDSTELVSALKQGDDIALYWRNRPEDLVVELVQMKG
jgi:type VI secretion system protein ImpJ